MVWPIMGWCATLECHVRGTEDTSQCVATSSRTAAPLSRIRLDANAIIDWVPAKGRSAALAVAHTECSGERAPGSLLSAHPQDTECRTSSLGRTGAFLVGLGQAPED